MSTEESRKALREFYKLKAGDSGSSSPSVNGSDILKSEPVAVPTEQPVEQDSDDFTELEELDQEDVDIDAFVSKTIKDYGLIHFIATANQIRKERNALASSQRELVNDNYKKLIQAAETLGYLSTQGDLAALEELQPTVHEFSEWVSSIQKPTAAAAAVPSVDESKQNSS